MSFRSTDVGWPVDTSISLTDSRPPFSSRSSSFFLPSARIFSERKMRLDPMEWYIDTRRYGTVPHGGFGLGFERMLSWVTGVSDVKDIVGFGRWKGNCRY